GQSDPRALWYYFPAVLSIKLTVPLLLAPVVLAVCRGWNSRDTSSRRPWYGNWALLCALTLLLFSLTCRVQIGVRFMFPLIALAAPASPRRVDRVVLWHGPGRVDNAEASASVADNEDRES